MAQVWLVTGSSRGLGRTIVEAGLAAGNKVLATAREIESLHDLSERHGDQIKLFALDVTDESAAASAVKAAIGGFGSLEVVINNAGYGNLSSVEDTPMSDFRAQIETNLFGTIIVTKAALPYFRQRKAGHFVQFSVYTARLKRTLAYSTDLVPPNGYSDRRARAILTISAMLGAINLSRAVSDPNLSREILKRTRDELISLNKEDGAEKRPETL